MRLSRAATRNWLATCRASTCGVTSTGRHAPACVAALVSRADMATSACTHTHAHTSRTLPPSVALTHAAPVTPRWRHHRRTVLVAAAAAGVAMMGAAGVAGAAGEEPEDGGGGAVTDGNNLSVIGRNSTPADTLHTEKLSQVVMRTGHGHRERFDALASSSRDGQPLMTFRDFLRSRVYHSYDFHGDMRHAARLASESRVGDLQGRITYPEFVFLTTILAVPMEHAAVAFLMCDLNQNGYVDRHELIEAITVLSKSTSSTAPMEVDPEHCLQYRLSCHLFGPRGDQPLSFERFVEFTHQLKADVLQAEFYHYSNGSDNMTHRQFAQYLVANSSPSSMNKRMERLAKIPHVDGSGFSLDEFMAFSFAVLENAGGIAKVVSMSQDRDGLSPAELIRVIAAVSGRNIPRHLMNTVFLVFDADGNGKLNLHELMSVVNRRNLQLTGKTHNIGSKWGRFLMCMDDLHRLD